MAPSGLKPRFQSGLEVSAQFSLHHLPFWPLLLAVPNWSRRFSLPVPCIQMAIESWSDGHEHLPPLPPASHQQKAWTHQGWRPLTGPFLIRPLIAKPELVSWLSSARRLAHVSVLSRWPPLVSISMLRQSASQWDLVWACLSVDHINVCIVDP